MSCNDCSRKNRISKKISKKEFKRIAEGLHENNLVPEIIWDGVFTKEIKNNYKISICTTCMGRTKDLKETLIKNIENNIDYPNLEFVVLNYNSNDDMDEWFKKDNLLNKYIEEKKLVYYKTNEPKFYSMSHSRNVAFKLATGDIVNNVDADAFILRNKDTYENFASYINRLANEQPEKAMFVKGKRMMRGRLGFFRSEFINLLGGYDETLDGYGHDDHDLKDRAWGMGFKMMWFGGTFHESIKTPKEDKTKNMKNKSWKDSENKNKQISFDNLKNKIFKANDGKEWGKAIVIKNFKEEIST